MGKFFIILNWKIYPTVADCYILPPQIKNLASEVFPFNINFILCPPAPFLAPIFEAVKPLPVNFALGAQDVSSIESGAATGEIAAKTISPWAKYSIVGHSEHRYNHHETNHQVSEKASLLLKYNLTPIICVGEEKKSASAEAFVREQLAQTLVLLDENARRKIILAYEPVWAIGAEYSAPQEYAEKMLLMLRSELPTETPVLYGGSVFEETAPLFVEAGFDGLFIGRASFKLAALRKIVEGVKYALNSRSRS